MKSKLFILNSKIAGKVKNEENVFDENDFHPCKSFFKEHKLSLNSIEYIFTKGVLEISPYIREILRRVDDLLCINGEFEIDFFSYGHRDTTGTAYRGLSILMYEIALCFENRFILTTQTFENFQVKLIYKKQFNRLPVNDSIDSWTFGIVSNGLKNDAIINIINQIIKFNVPNYEIIICGPSPYGGEKFINNKVIVLDDSDLKRDLRAPISAKKNRIVENAKFNNIILMHDRISFPNNWYEKMKDYGNVFDILAVQILDVETKSKRVQDWLIYKGCITDYSLVTAKLLKYDTWDSDIYIDGGFFISKRHLLLSTKYNDNLHWGEAEDVDLCKRLYLNGALISLDVNNKVFTSTHRHTGQQLFDKRSKFRQFLGSIKYKILKKRVNRRELFLDSLTRMIG